MTVMHEASITVDRITPAIGIELVGLRLRDVCSGERPELVDVIRTALADHHVVVFRDQFLTADEHAALAGCFGPILASPVQIATASSAAGRVGVVTTIEDNAQRPPAGFPWHTDLSWTQRPPSLGFLSAVTVPASGGDTLWASMTALFDRLTSADQQRCAGSTVTHAPTPALIESVRRHHGDAVADRLQRDHPGVSHPLVNVHPVTGRRSAFLSPLYATRIDGQAGGDDGLLRRLHDMIDDSHVQMRWRWRAGDFVIWDETSTCHRALTDHHPQRRVMRRCVTG